MALGDYTYWLRPQSGDVSPDNELGGNTLSGGTITLEDKGSGLFAWRFTGGAATATAPSRTTVPSGTGGGLTIAIDLSVNTYPSGSFTPFVSYSPDTTATNGIYVGASGANVYRARVAGTNTVAMTTFGTSRKVLVLRFKTNDPANGNVDWLAAWHESGGPGDSADYNNAAGTVASAVTYDTLVINAIESSVLDIHHLVLWSEELSDADCRTLVADGIAETLGGGSTPIAFTGTIPTLEGTVGAAFSEDLSSYFSGTETPFAYTVQSGTLPAGLTLNSSTGVISGTPTTPGTATGIVIRGTDATPDTDDSNSFSIDISPAAATSMTIALKQSDGTTAAASITGIEYAILNAATLGAATAILDTGTGESTDGSGNLVLDITGLGLVDGNVRYVLAGKSNGTVGADFDGWQGPATAAA